MGKHPDLDVDAGGFLDVASLLVELCSFRPALNRLADARDLDDQVFVV